MHNYDWIHSFVDSLNPKSMLTIVIHLDKHAFLADLLVVLFVEYLYILMKISHGHRRQSRYRIVISKERKEIQHKKMKRNTIEQMNCHSNTNDASMERTFRRVSCIFVRHDRRVASTMANLLLIDVYQQRNYPWTFVR
jgi:predicted membrane protein